MPPLTPDPAALDTIGAVTQLGADLQSQVLVTSALTNYAPMDGGPHMHDICVHDGELWVVHCESNNDGAGRDAGTGRIFVHVWDGSAWQQQGGDLLADYEKCDAGAQLSTERCPSRPFIISDGVDIYVGFCIFRGLLFPVSPAPVSFAPMIQLRRWVGGTFDEWECVNSHWFGSSSSAGAAGGSHQVRGDVTPDGVVWASLMWTLDGVGLVSSAGDALVLTSFGFPTDYRVLAAGGTTMIVYYDAGAADFVTVNVSTDTEIARVDRSLLVDPVTGVGGVVGNPVHHFYREDTGLYYVLANKCVFTISADGTSMLPLYGGDPARSFVKDFDINDTSASNGCMVWDEDRTGDDVPQVVVFDGNGTDPFQATGTASSAFIFQRQCQWPPPTWLRAWDMSGDRIVPEDGGSLATLAQYGQPQVVWYVTSAGGSIYVMVILARAAPSTPKVQVYEIDVCRDCVDCPDLIGSVFRSQLRIGEAAVVEPADLTPPSGNVFTQTPAWKGT